MLDDQVEHNIFDTFYTPTFIEYYKALRKKNNGVILIIADHSVQDNFFWELNNLLINNLKAEYEVLGKSWNPIIPLPLNSTEEEFITIMSKMLNGGTILIDAMTFMTLTFKTKNPVYFFCDRVFIHRSGEISVLAGRKF